MHTFHNWNAILEEPLLWGKPNNTAIPLKKTRQRRFISQHCRYLLRILIYTALISALFEIYHPILGGLFVPTKHGYPPNLPILNLLGDKNENQVIQELSSPRMLQLPRTPRTFWSGRRTSVTRLPANWCWNNSFAKLAFHLQIPSRIVAVEIGLQSETVKKRRDIAPNDIYIWGALNQDVMKHAKSSPSSQGPPLVGPEMKMMHIGTMQYDANPSHPYQSYNISENFENSVFLFLVFEIRRNWGSSSLTCIDDFKVLGQRSS